MTVNERLDLVGVSQRAASWQFELLNLDQQVVDLLNIDRDSPPTLRCDTSRDTKRSLDNVRFPPGLIDSIDPISQRLRLSMLLDDGTQWPQGTFLFSDPTKIRITAGLEVGVVNLVDLLAIVDQQASWSVALRPGDNITDAIRTQLNLFPIVYDLVDAGAVISPEAETVNWAAGTSRLKIINDLAAMIGYHELYFDNLSVAQMGPMPNPETVDADRLLSYPADGRTYLGSVTYSRNLLELPNRFTVVNTGANQVAIWGTYDIPASAPHSAANRGFIVTHVEQQQGVETNEQAREAARALARDGRFSYETLEFSGPPDPRHSSYDVVDFEGDRYLELSWSYPLTEGSEMRHVLRRTYEEVGASE